MKLRDFVNYVLLTLIWGFSFLMILKVAQAFGWAGAAAFRCLVAGCTLLAAGFVTGRLPDFRTGWRPFLVIGASTMAAQFIGLSLATPRIGTAMAAIFAAAIPLFSMIMAALWGIERLSLKGVLGLLLGFFGMFMLVGFPVVPVTGAFLFGCGASLFASLAAAFGSNFASLHLRGAGAFETTTGAFLSGGVMLLPLLFFVPVPSLPEPVDYLYLLILGVFMSALAYFMYFRLVSAIGPTRAISVEFSTTVLAVLIGTGLLGESLSLIQMVGACVILFSCALVLGLLSNG
ncbi:DMT family transporter, partial [Desulfococcaceae bacterium OttesenSCG-928-F15]|nr:DMT family transporter [Desulfococcaceae bacterium OttesenSCG-928-F15]